MNDFTKKVPVIFDRTHLAPLFDHSIGFDNLFDNLFDKVMPAAQSMTAYPPYNIKKIGDDRIIELALAGYSEDELSIELAGDILTISGAKEELTGNVMEQAQEMVVEYLHKGIAARKFSRQFTIAENAKVTGAVFKDGILSVTITMETPKAPKTKTIAISAA